MSATNVSDQETTSNLEAGFADHQVTVALEGASKTTSLLRQQDAHPLAIDMLLLTKFGADWLTWTPEFLDVQIVKYLGGLSDLNRHKVHALKALHMVDTFWQRWEVFVWCAMPFNNVPPDFVVMQVPTVAQCAVAAEVAKRVRDNVEWSSEVKSFIKVIFRHEELWCPVPQLDFIDLDASGVPVNQAEAKQIFERYLKLGRPSNEETIDAEQARHLWDVHHYVVGFEERARSQLRLVKS